MFIGLNQSIQSVMGLNHVTIDCRLSISSFIRVQLIHFWSRSNSQGEPETIFLDEFIGQQQFVLDKFRGQQQFVEQWESSILARIFLFSWQIK